MNQKILFITIIAYAILIKSYAQEDYSPAFIVNNQSDTIHGIGFVNSTQEYCFFKSVDNKKYIKYLPNEIKVIRFIDGAYYVSRQVVYKEKVEWFFLEYLVEGEIDLFSISYLGRFFIEKENESLIELRDNIKKVKEIDGEEYMAYDKKYIGYIRAYMTEAPELFPKIDQMSSLNKRQLVNLSVDYHNSTCDDYSCINYSKKLTKITYKIEFVSGMNYHNNYYSPQFGVLVHASGLFKSEKLFFKAGILYSDRPYWKKLEVNKDKGDFTIKIPISLQYVFGEKSFKPTLGLGISTGTYFVNSFQAGFIYSISEKIEISLNGSIDGIVALSANRHNDMYDNDLGHTFSFGLIFPFD